MRHLRLLISAVLVGVVFSSGVMADDDDRDGGRNAFVGLWQSVDSYDGSTQYLSITCRRKKDCDVRLNDTFFGLSCEDPPHTGFAQGSGSIKRNVLTVTLTFRCTGAATSASQLNEFVWDRRNDTLTNHNDDFDDLPPDKTPPPPPPSANVFHRISR